MTDDEARTQRENWKNDCGGRWHTVAAFFFLGVVVAVATLMVQP